MDPYERLKIADVLKRTSYKEGDYVIKEVISPTIYHFIGRKWQPVLHDRRRRNNCYKRKGWETGNSFYL